MSSFTVLELRALHHPKKRTIQTTIFQRKYSLLPKCRLFWLFLIHRYCYAPKYTVMSRCIAKSMYLNGQNDLCFETEGVSSYAVVTMDHACRCIWTLGSHTCLLGYHYHHTSPLHGYPPPPNVHTHSSLTPRSSHSPFPWLVFVSDWVPMIAAPACLAVPTCTCP